MHSHRYYHLALALLLLCTLAALVLASVTALGMHLTPVIAIGALAVAGALFAAMVFVHDALRAARWDAGHRLR
jgi:heme/copper-type cytochrome/quinol oxidase subunit 4